MNTDNAVTVNVIKGSVVGWGYFSYVLSLFVPSSATKYLKTIIYQFFMLSLTFFCLQVDTQPLFHVISMKQPGYFCKKKLFRLAEEQPGWNFLAWKTRINS